MRGAAIVMIGTLTLAGCGDPETNDDRGYTKAPLENPGLIVEGEPETDMPALGEPNRPRIVMMDEEEQASPEGDEASAEDAGQEQEVRLAEGVTQEQFDQGRELFTGSGCQACHGPDGGGTTLGPDLTDDQWLHVPGPDPEPIASVIREGVPQPSQAPAPMPAMGGANLSDEEIQALAGYVASIGLN